MRRLELTGMRDFDSSFTLDKPIEHAASYALSTLVPGLARWNYSVSTHTQDAIVLTRRYRRWAIWVLAVVLFPVGLLFLFVRDTAVITLSFAPDGDQTAVRASGDAPRRLRVFFRELEEARTRSRVPAVGGWKQEVGSG